MADYLPPSAYYAGDPTEARMRGAQLGRMRQQAAMERDMMAAEMQAYGATSPRELMLKKAIMTKETAAQEAQMKRLQDFGNIMSDVNDIKKAYGPKAAKEFWDTPEVKSIVSPFINTDYDPTDEGASFIAQSPFPGRIKAADGTVLEGQLEPGKAYKPVTTANDEYFEEVPITRKLAGETAATKGAAAARGLQWDKAASNLLMRTVGTTTASGIVIDPTRMNIYINALSLLPKYRGKDINTAVTQAIAEAEKSTGQTIMGDELPTETAAPKTADDYLKARGLK